MKYTPPNEKQNWELRIKQGGHSDELDAEVHMTRGEAEQFMADRAKTLDPSWELTMWPRPMGHDREMRTRGTATPRWDDLTRAQRKLAQAVEDASDGKDLVHVLRLAEADAKDKARVAEMFGGPGAGVEFRTEHISLRSKCRHCGRPGFFFDGIRDPYWVHKDRSAHGNGTIFEPNDAHTRRVFEKSSK